MLEVRAWVWKLTQSVILCAMAVTVHTHTHTHTMQHGGFNYENYILVLPT